MKCKVNKSNKDTKSISTLALKILEYDKYERDVSTQARKHTSTLSKQTGKHASRTCMPVRHYAKHKST